MPTAAFATLGCKVNQYETQRILEDFEQRGFAVTEFTESADVYVVNTCSVTHTAERKSRHMVRKLARQNPNAIVVMTGCYGEMARITGESVDEVTLIVPNDQKLQTLSHLLAAHPELEQSLPSSAQPPIISRSARRTRATIKVQDGCNVFCSFCSIPFTRKVMVSRTLEEIVEEAERRALQGYRELVVTGVLVGAYGQDRFVPIPGASLPRAVVAGRQSNGAAGPIGSADHLAGEIDLADCLLRLARVPGIQRVRLSSIEPTQVTDRLLAAFESEERLCPHLHIPLQSGDSGVLARMNRPYDREFYLDRCREAYRRIPDLAITSDIMVGFPGEEAAAFENTLDVVRKVGFARAHLFRYSPRPNTPAAEFGDQVPDHLKEERSKLLAAECRDAQQRFIHRFIGRTLEVLVEGKEIGAASSDGAGQETGNDSHDRVDATESSRASGQLLGGYTGNYIRAEFTGGSHLVGTLARVRLIEATAAGAVGEVGGAHFGPMEAPPDADFIPLASFSGTVRPARDS